jgi:uncharacterized protein
MASDPQAFFPGQAPIEAYGNGGFRFAEMSHRGSILCLPSRIQAWPVTAPEEITRESLRLVWETEPRPELLLLGTGVTLVPVSPGLRQTLREAGVRVDSMDTGAAARTYNVLLAEERSVAAALIAVA